MNTKIEQDKVYKIKLELELTEYDYRNVAYIFGFFLRKRESYPVDSHSETVAEKVLENIPVEIISEMLRYSDDVKLPETVKQKLQALTERKNQQK